MSVWTSRGADGDDGTGEPVLEEDILDILKVDQLVDWLMGLLCRWNLASALLKWLIEEMAVLPYGYGDPWKEVLLCWKKGIPWGLGHEGLQIASLRTT